MASSLIGRGFSSFSSSSSEEDKLLLWIFNSLSVFGFGCVFVGIGCDFVGIGCDLTSELLLGAFFSGASKNKNRN